MVESTQKSPGNQMMSKNGCVQSLLAFFTNVEVMEMQLLSKRVYDVISNVVSEIEIPSTLVVLERKRTEFYLSRVQSSTQPDQAYWKLFSIGDTDKPKERQYCEATLGFKEIYFQFFVAMNDYTYYAWPLIEEAFIMQGYKLTFDVDWTLISSKPIASPPERLMRPTILKQERKKSAKASINQPTHDLLFVGGVKERNSLHYDTVTDTWTWLKRLPPGHNITCNVAVNWQEKALFTFVLDGQLNLKAAVLPLEDLDKLPTREAQTEEMSWALQIEADSSNQDQQEKPKFPVDNEHKKHFIDRFHLKCAVVMPDKSIIVCARGRYPSMKEAVSTLFLRFDVKYDVKQKVWSLVMRQTIERCFPTVFPRQLDHMARNNLSLVMVQDTPDSDDFEVMCILMDKKRERNPENQVHKVLTCNKLVEKP